jgi:hypothetical protein
MRILSILMAAGLGLSACGGKAGELDALAKRACACKDKACAEAVANDLEKVTNSLKESDMNQETAKAMSEVAGCLLKLESLDDDK